jgi:hypothetical protein
VFIRFEGGFWIHRQHVHHPLGRSWRLLAAADSREKLKSDRRSCRFSPSREAGSEREQSREELHREEVDFVRPSGLIHKIFATPFSLAVSLVTFGSRLRSKSQADKHQSTTDLSATLRWRCPLDSRLALDCETGIVSLAVP